MTQSDQLKAVIMVAVVVLSVVAASGLAGAEVNQNDPAPVDIIEIDDDGNPNPNPAGGAINTTSVLSSNLAEVQSASGPSGTDTSVITVSINTTINGTNSTDPVAITLTDSDSSNPVDSPLQGDFGVNGTNSVTRADGDSKDLSPGGSSADGNLTVKLAVNAGTGSFTDGDNLTLVVDGEGDTDFNGANTEAIDPAVVVNNRVVDPAIQIGGPINGDGDPDIVDANNPRPDLDSTSQNDNDADGDAQQTAHSREQVKILSNITRDGSPQIADVVANISELSINTSRDNQTVPMHLDVDNNGRIDDSERGQDGANGTYIGRFYLNDTDGVNSSNPRVNVTVTDTVGGTNQSRTGGDFTAQAFAGLGVGDSVVTGEDPENDQISGNRTTEPNRTQSPTNESINYYVYGQEGDNKVTVVFETELQGDNSTAVSGFFSDDDATNGLSRDDFSYIDNDAEGATSIQSVQHQPGSHVAVLTLDDDLSQDDVVGTSPLSDEIRVPANETYISVGALSPSAGGDVFPLVTNRTQSLETDQSIFPTNITDVTTQTKDPTVPGRDVNPEEQITVNATFSVHPYGQNDSLNDTQVAVSLRGTDTKGRTLLKQSFEDGLVDGAEFSDETIRLDDESIVIGRGDRDGSDPDGSVVTTLNLDAFPPGGASAGNLTVEAQAYGLFDNDTIDNPSNATDRSITVDSVRPVVIGATTQPGGSGTNNVNGQNFDSNRVIELTFSEPILGNDANDPDRSDFEYNNNNNGNATEIVRVGRASGSANDRLFLAMDARVTTEDIDEDSIEVVPNQIVDAGDIGGLFEIGNTARGGLKEVNRTAIPLNITQAQDDPGVSVFPGAVKGDDAVLVTTESNLGLSQGNDVLIQLEDANGNNLVNQTTGNREAVRITDNGPNDLDSEDAVVATRILLTDIAGGEAQAGDLTAIAEASITDPDTNQIDDLDNADAESDPITIDNTRPTVVGNVTPVDSNELEVNFSEPVFARELSRERLTTDEIDFDDNNQGGATEIVSVDHTPGETSAILTMNADVTTQGSSADVNDDEVTFDVDQVEDKAGNSLIPGSESVPLGERRVDDLNVDTTASGEIAVEAIDDGSPKTGVAVTFAVTSGDGSFSNGEQLIEKETITQNNVPQAIATLSGNGTVEVSAGGLTETIDEFAVEGEPPTATVRFDDQTVENGSSSVNVASATFDGSEDFVIVVHQSSPGENGVVDDTSEINGKIGSSDVLTSNTVSNVPVDLTKELDENLTQLSENQSLIAMLHFANDSGGTNFGSPIVRDGSPVFDQANITVQEQVADPEPPENPVVGDSQAPAADINGDGKLEDVNGDGEVTFDDAVTLAFNTGDVSGNDSFDFDDDGDVDFDDAIELAFQ